MNKLIGLLIVALSTSTPALATEGSKNVLCESENLTIQVELQQYGVLAKATAVIKINGETWNGVWSLMAAPAGTRLTGYDFLNVGTIDSPQGSLQINTLLTPYGGLSGSWLTMPGMSGSIECKFID
ncbi:MAG: hypothetical protein ACKOX6_08155 [Bdellovibrio sp.]